MGTVLVAGDDDPRDTVVGDQAAVVVSLGDHRVHPLQYTLGDARRAPEPGRGRDDEDLRGEQALADPWPLVALAHIRLDSRLDLVVDGPDRLDLDVPLGERL